MITKLSVLIVSIISISVEGIVNQDEIERSVFQEWKSNHKRNYSSNGEERKAMRNLMKNKQEIERHNIRYKAGIETYSRGLWEMSDLSFEEKSEILANSNSNFTQLNLKGPPKRLQKGPSQVNWVTQGRVNSVQNQGRCGSCFAFAAVGTAEGVMLKNGIKTRLSVQQIVDCDKLDDGCEGLLIQFEIN